MTTQTIETTTYRVWTEAGVCLGEYEGETPSDAIEALHRDAGYASTAAAAEALGSTAEALRSELRCERVLVDVPAEAE